MKIKLLKFALIVFVFNLQISAQKNPWKSSVKNFNLKHIDQKDLIKDKYTVLSLDFESLKSQLNYAPQRGIASNLNNVTILFPDSKGAFSTFSVFEAPVLAPSLAQKYPDIRSYVGFSEKGDIIRFSIDSRGLEATIINTKTETTYIQFSESSSEDYIAYSSKAQDIELNRTFCGTHDGGNSSINSEEPNSYRDANDQVLRTYRMAVSATGEYTQFHGGTVADALAAINATMTRVNMVFETDMAVTFQIQDYDQLIYLDALSDPYADSDVGSDPDNYGTLDAWGTQLQNNLTAIIGNAAYDIGHLFATNSSINGNAGCIDCVCVDDDSLNNLDRGKGAAYTSSNNPIGEFFDLVTAHEIGHQMGANHTWAFAEESGTITNSEPGSGSTIMGYAGITGDDNVVLGADPYFHYHSIRQITDGFASNSCWQGNNPLPITNNPPTVSAGSDYTIPMGTAYVLRGNATDADVTDNLYYCWEGTDNGQVAFYQFGPTRTVGSMVRSLPPTNSPNRYIPNLAMVATNQLTETNPNINSSWETVSTVNRTLNYALTVRDRQPNALGLGGQTAYDTMQITVDENSGPFTVTSQSSFENWFVGEDYDITWDVAGTDTGLINSQSVNIKLSLDNGLSYPIVLASNIPNNGSTTVTIPSVGESGEFYFARVMVESNDNIFFAVNSTYIYLSEIEFSLTRFGDTYQQICSPDEVVFNFTYNTYLGYNGDTTFTTDFLPEGLVATFEPSTVSQDGTDVTVTLSNTDNMENGTNYPYFFFYVIGNSGDISNLTFFEAIIFDSNFVPPTTISPEDEATNINRNPLLSWNADFNAESHMVEIADNAAFENPIYLDVAENYSSQPITGLSRNTEYFWRIKPMNNCHEGNFTETYSFITENCARELSPDIPRSISSGSGAVYTSTLNITEDFIVEDIDIRIDMAHSATGDLIISLTNPMGSTIILSDTNGGYGDGYVDTVFDDEATQSITSGFPPYNGSYIPENSLSQFDGISSMGLWTLTIEDTRFYNGGTLREFELYLCGDQSLSNLDVTSDDFTLYPNPSNGFVNIKLPNTVIGETVNIEIYDLLGKKVQHSSIENVQNEIENYSLNQLSDGLYIIKFRIGKSEFTKKLVVNYN